MQFECVGRTGLAIEKDVEMLVDKKEVEQITEKWPVP